MGNPFSNIGSMGEMMKQAKKMMEAVQKVQEALAEERIEATSGGGMVTAIANGQGDLVGVKINPQVVDPEDVEMLEDLVTTAVREVLSKARQLQAERMNEATGGLAGGLTGMF
jgi:DNA-binding YbaB/EbfC family protein